MAPRWLPLEGRALRKPARNTISSPTYPPLLLECRIGRARGARERGSLLWERNRTLQQAESIGGFRLRAT